MFNRNKDEDKKFRYAQDDEKFKRRADLLYGNKNDKDVLAPLIESEKYVSKSAKEDDTPKYSKVEKDYSKTVDLLYPTMKDKKVENKEDVKEEKKETPLRKRSLKDFDLNDDDYDVEDNAITPKNKKEYSIINNLKYPKNTGNEEVEELKKQANKVDEEIYKEENARYLRGTKAWKEKIAVDFVDKPPIKAIGKTKKGNEAAENLHMSKTKSYMDTAYAKEHKVYNNYDEAPSNLKSYFKNKISEQIGDDKLDKTKGIYIDSDSESSKSLKDNLLKDADFVSKLKTYDKALKNNYSINDSIRLKGNNWKNAVGSADIRNMHINKNGDLELHIADVYDFNAHEKSNLVRVGRDRQDKGEITPYFYAYRVIIPKEEKDKVLKIIDTKGDENE